MIVRTSVPASQEDEYGHWYVNTHIPQILQIPGFVGAERYKLDAEVSGGDPCYLTVFELEADDLHGPLRELGVRSADGRVERSEGVELEPPPTVSIYVLLDG